MWQILNWKFSKRKAIESELQAIIIECKEGKNRQADIRSESKPIKQTIKTTSELTKEETEKKHRRETQRHETRLPSKFVSIEFKYETEPIHNRIGKESEEID